MDGHPFYFAGWNNYYLPQYSADPNGNYERVADVDVAFRCFHPQARAVHACIFITLNPKMLTRGAASRLLTPGAVFGYVDDVEAWCERLRCSCWIPGMRRAWG